MGAEDELVLPQVPDTKPEDPEDVSWALSTAEAMWARGDHLEGIKWVRKAAEAASDVEDDMRALELAKAASELAALLTRRSQSVPDGSPAAAGAAATEAPAANVAPASAMPVTARSGPASVAPPAPPTPPPGGATVPPLPSKPPGLVGKASPRGASAAPRPLATATKPPPLGPQAGKGILSNRASIPGAALSEKPDAKDAGPPSVKGKSKRRSRESMEVEALAVTAPPPGGAVAAGDAATMESAGDRTIEVGAMPDVALVPAVEKPAATSGRTRKRTSSRPDDSTVVTTLEELEASKRRSAQEWDSSPTMNLAGDEVSTGDRVTAFAVVPAVPPAPVGRPSSPPINMDLRAAGVAVTRAPAKSPSARPPAGPVHDPRIETSQAVRVVVWRDANGVHIAPAGTRVSSITIDAVLVALEPSADLTAWLSPRER